MTGPPEEIIASFRCLDVVVIGEAMLDTYLEGTSTRLSQEGPVPIVDVSSRTDAPGGAANVALNAAGLGARVTLLSAVGDDDEGAMVSRLLREGGVSTTGLVLEPGRQTLSKQRVLCGSQLVARLDKGTKTPLRSDAEAELIESLRARLERSDAVIVSDYGYGILTPATRATLAELQLRRPRVLVVDAKDLSRYRALSPTAVKPNRAQVAELLGAVPEGGDWAERIVESGDVLLQRTGAAAVAVSLDCDGAVLLERGRPAHRTFARRAADARAVGGGDTFVAGLTLALAAGAHTPAAAEVASAAAAVAVGKAHTACCRAHELREAIASSARKFVSDRADLGRLTARRRAEGRRIVFTNGCFDLLHRGHITYLNHAKLLGDILIVGVNSDESVARLKGPGRPITALRDRVEVLTALSSVDLVTSFDEDTPAALIESVRPDVFVKGGDYTPEMLPEADIVRAHGGEIRIVDYLADTSTTAIIERIRRGDEAVPGPGR